MSEKAPEQASSMDDRDQLSALEESMASSGLSDLDSEHSVILKDWSAQDFANIYVRFRPHLISHARKLLREEAQAEEVVQDAFLYLMTALPELDSELGVLRFLKWKTKMLAIDLIRRTSTDQLTSGMVDTASLADPSPLPDRSLELAEEAAIVQLALAKIHPRQREVLVATVLEERSTEEVATRMGLTDNALRQLNYRARQSFKRSLTNEIEARGLSLNQFLGGAIRRAIEGSKRAVISGGATVLLLATVSVFGGLQFLQESNLAEQSESLSLLSQSQVQSGNEAIDGLNRTFGGLAEVPTQNFPPVEGSSPTTFVSDMDPVEFPEPTTGASADLETLQVAEEFAESKASSNDEQSLRRAIVTAANLEKFSSIFSQELTHKLGDSSVSEWDFTDETNSLQVRNSSGLQVELVYDLSADSPIRFAWISFSVDGATFIAVPNVAFSKLSKVQDGYVVEYVATDLVIGDVGGKMGNLASNQTDLSRAALFVSFSVGPDKEIRSIEMNLNPRA